MAKSLMVEIHQAKEIAGLLGVQRALIQNLPITQPLKKQLFNNIEDIRNILKEGILREE